MSDQPVSRRLALGTLAGGIVGTTLVTSAVEGADNPERLALPNAEDANAARSRSPDAGDGIAQTPRDPSLLAPLAAGSRVLSWEVVAIEPLETGSIRVQLRGDSQVAFAVEVLARDGSPFAARPPAETEKFGLYVSNGGDGRMPTVEEQGLAAMALAQIVARNEARVSTEGFLTQAQRIEAHATALLQHLDGSNKPAAFEPAASQDVLASLLPA